VSHIGNLYEIMAMRARRANPVPIYLHIGELKAWNPANNTVDVYLPHVDGANSPTTQTFPMPLMTGITGPNYGDQVGPDTSGTQPLQVVVACGSPDGDDYVALGFLYTANQQPPGAPATELWRVDKRGSSLKLTVDGKTVGDGAGGAKLLGDGYASVVAPLTELGAQNLDPSEDAVIRKTDLDAALSALTAHVQTALNTLAGEVQGGSGVSSPSIVATTSTGSSIVKAAN